MGWRTFLALSLTLNISAFGQISQGPTSQKGHEWWRHAVVYEIYPRSYADKNNDGIGDIRGITAKLDYLKNLGIDTIWITPCYPSPQADFGYDVSDYEGIDPMYGTLDDFDGLIREAKRRGIRIVMDLVVNHTSDQHPWFLDSKSSRTSIHRDWYIWRNGRSPGQPPNNWVSTYFGGSAWTFDSNTAQYYYHFFRAQQPDLNWRNPDVEKAMLDVTRWWYSRGVFGFRLDAVGSLFEDADLRDNPTLSGTNEFGDSNEENKFNENMPEIHAALRKLRQVADEKNAVLIGEAWTDDVGEVKAYYGHDHDELQLPMTFTFCQPGEMTAAAIRGRIAAAESTGEWPVYVLGNHDITRSIERCGDGQHNDQIAKLTAALYLTLRGTPIMYYGEEIGMENHDPIRKEDVRDPMGTTGWPQNKGRDGERTPMQWSASKNGGFSKATPWLSLPESYKQRNVDVESHDANSILVFYKRLLALRHRSRALLDGDYIGLNQTDPDVISYLRRYGGETILVALNVSANSQKVTFDLRGQGFTGAKRQTILSTTGSVQLSGPLSQISLDPFSVFIARIF